MVMEMATGGDGDVDEGEHDELERRSAYLPMPRPGPAAPKSLVGELIQNQSNTFAMQPLPLPFLQTRSREATALTYRGLFPLERPFLKPQLHPPRACRPREPDFPNHTANALQLKRKKRTTITPCSSRRRPLWLRRGQNAFRRLSRKNMNRA